MGNGRILSGWVEAGEWVLVARAGLRRVGLWMRSRSRGVGYSVLVLALVFVLLIKFQS